MTTRLRQIVMVAADLAAAEREIEQRLGVELCYRDPGVATFRERARANDVRVVYEAVADGIVGLHLHPADVGGAILSIDQPAVAGEWPWAGPAWSDHVVTERDLAAMAARWGAVLGIEPQDATLELDGGGAIDFVPAGSTGEGVSGFTLRAVTPEQAGSATICNCHFELVAP